MRIPLSFVSSLLALAGPGAAQPPTVANCTVFAADNIWNTRVDQLNVHPSSSTWVNTIGTSAHLHPDFGSGLYNGAPIGIPYLEVPGTQTKYPATFTYQSESDPGPYAIPLNAPIEGGSSSTGDRHVIAVDIDHCVLYEIYDGFPQAASWQGGSGAIFNLLSDALRPATWTSADAAGLPIFPGLVRYDEIVAGEIRHAIRFTVPETQNTFVWPARHEASSLTGAQYPPMGARFRLKASFDIASFSATNQIILTALKRYGMMLADNGSAWYISGAPDARWDNNDLHVLNSIAGSNFEAVDVSPLMANPNTGQALQNSVSVNVAPPMINVPVNGRQQFTATVNGNSNQSVTWDVNGVIGGNASVGFIDSIGGLYTAPAVVPSPASVTLHATSVAVNSAVGSASVTITGPPLPDFSLAISAGPGSVGAGGRATYTITVTGSNGFGGTVTFGVSGLPAGAAGSFNPASVIGSGTSTLIISTTSGVAPGGYTVKATGANGSLSHSASASLNVTSPPPLGPGLQFVPVTPCRIADTRKANGPFGGPSIGASASRDFAVPASACGIPANAQAYSLNLTVVPLGPLGFVSLWPAGQPQATVSTLNSIDGRIKANAALVPAGANGAVTIFASNPTHVIVDINGYFVAPGSHTLAFYPLTACRIADTRLGTGTFAGPALAGGQARSFPIPSSACNIPANAQAYALNMTVVPSGPLGFLSAWAAGSPQPVVSTLNAPTGTVTANTAIVRAGSGGGITVMASNPTHLIIDINGYFAPPGGAGGLLFRAVTPCRILDTRNPSGPFGGPQLSAGEARSFVVLLSSCQIPGQAQAYSLNATVVPPGPLGFLTLWGNNPMPTVSTLNDSDASIVANAALVPAAADGSVSAFASNATHLILDINGYFAP